jgi:phosphate:Na+ symporter
MFSNPILGVLAGMVLTAIIQSSSASVGILQALSSTGQITFGAAVPIIMGQNIGTCVTALLSSIGTNRNARRTTVIHISFNVIGTVIFTTLCLVTPLIAFMENLTPTNPSAQIANLHTIFNVVTSLLLIPFGGLLTLLAEKLLPDKGDKKEEGPALQYLLDLSHINADKLGAVAISTEGIRKELQRMLDMARENVIGAFWVFAKKDTEQFKEIEQREAYVDFLNKEISKYITKVGAYDNTQSGSQQLNSYFTITSNIERLSDHAINIAGYSRILEEKQIQFSEAAEKEIWQMQNVCKSLFEMLQENYKDVVDWHSRVSGMEQKIDDMTKDFRSNMYERIHKGLCSDEGSILFSEMLTDFERIGDHALNISDEMVKIVMAEGH